MSRSLDVSDLPLDEDDEANMPDGPIPEAAASLARLLSKWAPVRTTLAAAQEVRLSEEDRAALARTSVGPCSIAAADMGPPLWARAGWTMALLDWFSATEGTTPIPNACRSGGVPEGRLIDIERGLLDERHKEFGWTGARLADAMMLERLKRTLHQVVLHALSDEAVSGPFVEHAARGYQDALAQLASNDPEMDPDMRTAAEDPNSGIAQRAALSNVLGHCHAITEAVLVQDQSAGGRMRGSLFVELVAVAGVGTRAEVGASGAAAQEAYQNVLNGAEDLGSPTVWAPGAARAVVLGVADAAPMLSMALDPGRTIRLQRALADEVLRTNRVDATALAQRAAPYLSSDPHGSAELEPRAAVVAVVHHLGLQSDLLVRLASRLTDTPALGTSGSGQEGDDELQIIGLVTVARMSDLSAERFDYTARVRDLMPTDLAWRRLHRDARGRALNAAQQRADRDLSARHGRLAAAIEQAVPEDGFEPDRTWAYGLSHDSVEFLHHVGHQMGVYAEYDAVHPHEQAHALDEDPAAPRPFHGALPARPGLLLCGVGSWDMAVVPALGAWMAAAAVQQHAFGSTTDVGAAALEQTVGVVLRVDPEPGVTRLALTDEGASLLGQVQLPNAVVEAFGDDAIETLAALGAPLDAERCGVLAEADWTLLMGGGHPMAARRLH